MAIVTLDIDLAKDVSALHGVDATSKAVLAPDLPRSKLPEVVSYLPPCLFGMVEACSSASHWARLLQAHGHTVRWRRRSFLPIGSQANEARTTSPMLHQAEHLGFIFSHERRRLRRHEGCF